MNIKDLKDVLNKFIDSRENAILIDGPWGSGKTHCITDFIRECEVSKKIYYMSLFGKSSIEDIHNELYALVHPNLSIAKNAIKIAARSVKLFNGNLDLSEGLDFVLKKNKKVKFNSVIIFDDMERIHDSLSFDQLLGYFNNLLLGKNKIILSSDMSKVENNSSKRLLALQEKIIDRVYKISSTDNQVINEIFQDYKKYLNSFILKLINNNLRTASKIMNLYSDIIDYLSQNEKCKYWNQTISYNDLLLNCSLVVSEFSHQSMFNYKSNTDEETRIRDYLSFDFHGDSHKIDRIFRIKMYYENYRFDFSEARDINTNLIGTIIDVYYMNNFESLSRIFETKTIKLSEPFYMSDNHKLEYIQNNMDELMKFNGNLTSEHFKVIENIITINAKFGLQTNLNHIISKFADLLLKDSSILDIVTTFASEKAHHYNDFLKELSKLFTVRYNQSIYNLLLEYNNERSYTQLIQLFEKIEKDAIFCDNDKKINDEHLLFLESYNYFLPNIEGDIDSVHWKLCYSITKCLRTLKRGNELKAFYKTQLDISTNNISMSERLNLLINVIEEKKHNLA
jgi:hypothetical protein